MASILAIKHNIVPPTINFEHKDENLDPNLDFTFNKAREEKWARLYQTPSALEVTTHRCCSRNSLNYMGIINRLFRRDDRTGEIDVLIKTHFNLRIKTRSYYEEALRHSSVLDGDKTGKRSNERLEYLGDAVLDLCVAHYLYKSDKKAQEGLLTQRKSQSRKP